MKVLFLCTLNAVRSPMAEGLGKALFPEHEFHSAGIAEGPLDFMAVEVMGEIEIDISNHVSRTLDSLRDKKFDVVICLAKESEEEAKKLLEFHGFKNVEFWNIPSPGIIRGNRYMQLFSYREIRDLLRTKIRQRFNF